MSRPSTTPDAQASRAHEGLPVVRALSAGMTSLQAFHALRTLPHVALFDSAMPHATLGRYSFVAADPFRWLEAPADGRDALGLLEAELANYPAATAQGLPPFQGGAAGLLAYELCHSLERLPRPAFDEFGVPALAMGLYDVVLAFDHAAEQGWIVSQGFPETDPAARRARAAARAEQFLQYLEHPPADDPLVQAAAEKLAANELAPQFPLGSELYSDFSREAYLEAVTRAVEYIHAGDVFQVNLSQRLLLEAKGHPADLYLRLRERNPAPFAGYFDTGDFQIASASPERFLQLCDQRVETRPIKGTRRRTARPEADLFAGVELSQSVKDRAENVMIVDLLRNDLSRVCQPDSVRVAQLCGLETYAHVQHLVSVVEGRLVAGRGPVDLLRASLPGGSITGAPKVRAMEIIAEIEPTTRGAYCGSLAYIGFDGAMDSSILIRTITAGRGWWQIPVGGGIVADSDPRLEYEETWHKAAGMLDISR